MRVTERLMRHGVLEPSQYGAVPKAGTLPPRRVLAAVFDDANMSEKEMHLLLLDLKKAFDTCEYWSQALSWRALGAPEDLIKILLNLDAGSNSPADPHPGPGATTRVILANGPRKRKPILEKPIADLKTRSPKKTCKSEIQKN